MTKSNWKQTFNNDEQALKKFGLKLNIRSK